MKTCRKVSLQINLFRDDILHLPSMSLVFLRSARCGYGPLQIDYMYCTCTTTGTEVNSSNEQFTVNIVSLFQVSLSFQRKKVEFRSPHQGKFLFY
jgi:hypothetical protein